MLDSGGLVLHKAKYSRMGSVLCASGASGVAGLISGHTYSILTVKRVKKTFRMVKIRNPWGSGEWLGPWSDKSDMWTKHADVKKVLSGCVRRAVSSPLVSRWGLPPVLPDRPLLAFPRACVVMYMLCIGTVTVSVAVTANENENGNANENVNAMQCSVV